MKTIGLATLGRDAELRYLENGDAVCDLALATNYGRKGQDGKQPTQWINATLWGKRAEALAQYLTKGSRHCFTLDELHIEEYEGKNGAGPKLVARVADVELGPRVADSQETKPNYQKPAPQRQTPASADDDDIPF